MRTPLKDAARGRWKAILPALGVPLAFMSGKHQACPLCGGGKDRARFDDKDGRGTWICTQCGAGDGIELVKRFRNVDFKGAAELIEPLIGTAPYREPKPETSDDTKRKWLRELWDGAIRISADDPAGLWLARRTGISSFPHALRYHDAVAAKGDDGHRVFMPGMLAKVSDKDGMPVNVHRTYLTFRGEKAPIAKPRAMMPGQVPEGSAVRLFAQGDELGIAEGIETAIAASILHDIPCWAALNAVQLSKWIPPAGVKRVLVFADNDTNFTGQNAAYQLANRLTVKAKIDVEVRTPREVGTDWNDVLMRKRLAEAETLV